MDVEAPSPQIGADEWVARSGERRQAGALGRVRLWTERLPRPVRVAGAGAVVALVALVPVMTTDDYILRVGVVSLIFALLALGLNVSVGLAGLLDLGYIAFYGVGAYGYAMLSSSKFGVHWALWESLPVILAASMLVGFLLALPSRRLVGDYLAIVTLFFGQIFYTIAVQGYRVPLIKIHNSHDITGGPNGIAAVDDFHFFGVHVTTNKAYYWFSLAAVVVVFVALHFLNHSRTGRAWRAHRDDPLATQLMGMPINWLKLLAIAVGASVGALAGTINAASLHGAFPDDYSTPVLITIYAMVILGGSGSLLGVVVGAVTVNVLLEVLRTPDHARWILYIAILLTLVAKVRPWRKLGALLVATVAFGIAVHAIVAAAWPRGVHGLVSISGTDFSKGGWLGWGLRHWLVLPGRTYELGQYTWFNVALVALIGLVLALTMLRGWARWVALVPTLWLAALVWETRLVEEGTGPTRFLLLGAILVVLMAARPQGLLGTQRVEIV
jgi:ABC-type branched-subunit amino acid transport system permease subunit